MMLTESKPAEDTRLDALESRIIIGELVHRYARFIRYDLPEDISSLFTRDGVFEIRDGHPDRAEYQVRARLEGREHIAVYLTRGKGQPHPVPLIHNLIVNVDGDSATANCVMEGKMYRGKGGVQGEYRDTFRREAGRWYFSERIFTIYQGGSEG